MVWPQSRDAVHNPETGVNTELLKEVGRASVALPDGFKIHSKLQRHIKARLTSIESGSGPFAFIPFRDELF